MTEIRAKSIIDYFNEFAKVNAELGETLNVVKNTIKAEQTGEILTAEEQKKSFKTITDTTKGITKVLRDGLFDKVEDPTTRTITYVPRLQLPPPGGMPAAGAMIPVPVGGPGAAVAFGDPVLGAPPAPGGILPLPVPAILNAVPGPLNDPNVQFPASPAGSRAASPVFPASPVGSRPASPVPQGPQVMDIQEVAKMPQWYRDNVAGVPPGGELDINLTPSGLMQDYSIFNRRVYIDKQHFDVGELTMIDADDGSFITNKKPITDGILGLLIPAESARKRDIWRIMSPDELDWWYELVKAHYYDKAGMVKTGAKADLYKQVKSVKDAEAAGAAGAAAIGPVGGDGIPILDDYIAKQGGLNNNAVYLYLADTLMRKYVQKDKAWTKTHGMKSDRYKNHVEGQDVKGLYRSWLILVKEGKSVPPLPAEDLTKIQQFLFPKDSPASSSSTASSSSAPPPPPPPPPPSPAAAAIKKGSSSKSSTKKDFSISDVLNVTLKKTGAMSKLTKEQQEQFNKVSKLEEEYNEMDRQISLKSSVIATAQKDIKDATEWRNKSKNKATKQKYQDDINEAQKKIDDAKTNFNFDVAKAKLAEMKKTLDDEKVKLPVIETDIKKAPGSAMSSPIASALEEAMKKRRDTLSPETDGSGLKKHLYTVQPDGTFGALKIDIPLLKSRHILKVKRNNKLIINQDVDADTVRLLTQRFFSTKKYSDRSKDIFTQLVKLAELPVELRNTKYKLITGGCGSCEGAGSVYMFNKPDEAIDRLEVLIGSLSAGNNSKNVKNEMQSVMDYLLKMRKLTKAQHKLLFDTYILSR